MNITGHMLIVLLPLILPAIGSLVALVLAAIEPEDRTKGPVIVVASAAASIAAMRFGPESMGPLMQKMLVMDGYSIFFLLLIMSMLAGAACIAMASFRASDYAHGEYWALLLFAACGMGLLATARNLIIVFIGIEVMSISIYALVGSDRSRKRSSEAALKYFLLGAFASAFLLFGIAFVYGASGSLDLQEISATASAGLWGKTVRAEMFLGLALMLVGFGFKTSTVPFHMWTPDAYSGAPAPVTAFMASAVKAASFAAFVRVFVLSLGATRGFWSDAIAVGAAATMIGGNFGALAQSELKRLFAYSSIAHAGYVLVGLRAASIDPNTATPSILFYLLAYAFTSLGAFAAIAAVERWQGKELTLDDLAGLGKRHPLIAASMTIFLLALAGVPPTAGFAAKFYVFSSAVKIGDVLLAVIGVLTSAVSLFYYLRVIVCMYMREPDASREITTPAAEPFARMPSIYAVVFVAVAVVVVAGVAPDAFMEFARNASSSAVFRIAGL